MNSVAERVVPKAFVWRRLHSLMGFWLVLFLTLHLVTNSQAALWIGDDGHEFVKIVNVLESLPYLQIVEIFLIGIPILIHGILGIKYALSAKHNASGGRGKKPRLSYGRNRAFNWQRYASWIILIGIVVHVVQMRFLDFPKDVVFENKEQYLVRLSFDPGLYTLSQRLWVSLYPAEEILDMQVPKEVDFQSLFQDATDQEEYSALHKSRARDLQEEQEYRNWVIALKQFDLAPTELVAAAPSPGKAMLLSVRNTFKSFFWSIFYSVFVIATCFHAFNGLWTFLITWGALLSMRSQKSMIPVCISAIFILSFLGLAAIWGSYWVNLRY